MKPYWAVLSFRQESKLLDNVLQQTTNLSRDTHGMLNSSDDISLHLAKSHFTLRGH